MKIRNGFVSNSSTSSFCIYGVCLEKKVAKALTEKLGTGGDTSHLCDYFRALIKDANVNLTAYRGDPNYGEFVYIGRSWSSIKDDETGKMFKDKIKADILKLLNNELPNVAFATLEEAWYDG